jgi:hypothetical protein
MTRSPKRTTRKLRVLNPKKVEEGKGKMAAEIVRGGIRSGPARLKW